MSTTITNNTKWAEEYLGIAFEDRGLTREGLDCWGLVRLILIEQCGIVLPEYSGIGAGETLQKFRTIRQEALRAEWTEIQPLNEKQYDVVLMRGQFSHEGTKHSRPIHIGCVVCPGTLVHIEMGSRVSVVNYRTHIKVRSRVVSFYRHARLVQG